MSQKRKKCRDTVASPPKAPLRGACCGQEDLFSLLRRERSTNRSNSALRAGVDKEAVPSSREWGLVTLAARERGHLSVAGA